jgi:hypothetical protein
MKKFKQLMEGLPPKKIVFAFGRFQPPTIGHELLVNTVKRVAGSSADHVIYASKTQDAKKNPLSVDRKLYYLKRMFPGVNFAGATDQQRTFIEVAKALNKKYRHIVMVAGSDRIAEYKRLLNNYNGKDFNFDSIEVVSAGERDPDADNASGMSGTKMREAAKRGDFKSFKTGLPHTITEVDSRRLMNELRKASGLQPIKETLNIEVDDLREKYFRGDIFNVGDIVESNGDYYSIVKRGSNHLLVQGEDGSLTSKWIQDVNEQLTSKTLKSNDKIKVARLISTMLGVDAAENMSSPDQLINAGLRKVRTRTLNPELVSIIRRMLTVADGMSIGYDKNLLPSKLKEEDMLKFKDYVPVLENEETWTQRVIDEAQAEKKEALPMYTDTQFEDDEWNEELTEQDIEDIVNSITDDDILNDYDDEELLVVDEETGEVIDPYEGEEIPKINEEDELNEVLSRIERIKSKVRFRRTKAKRQRRLSLALKRTSNTQTINRRARRMAVKALKQRFVRKPLSKLSVGEKERIEQRISKMKPFLNRIAMRMAPKVRRLERDRVRGK